MRKLKFFLEIGRMKLLLFLTLVILLQPVFAQEKKEKRERFPTYVAFHGNAILPNTYQDSKSLTLTDSLTRSSITQNTGRSFGAILRVAYNSRFALETGLTYSVRNFKLDMEVLDTNISAVNSLKFTTYDIPLNGLIFLKMSENIFANAGLGMSVQYKPSAVRTSLVIDGTRGFSHAGLLTEKFGFTVNGQIGAELRTRKDGFIYLGGSVRVPLSNLFIFQSRYQYKTSTTTNAGEFKAGFLGIDFRYYFHNKKNKGPQPIEGPAVE